MTFLLDTNVLIAMFRGKENIRKAILEAGIEHCAVSEITLAEIVAGAYKGGIDKHRHEIMFLKEKFSILPISPYLETYGRIRAELEIKGERLDSFDLLLGATALDENLTIVTHNQRHLGCIKGIRLLDWESV